MRRGRQQLAAAAVALTTAGCGFLPPFGGGEPSMEPVGPRFEMGPAPVFDEDGRAQDGPSWTYFRTRDGWCAEGAEGGMCSSGPPPEGGFDGFSGSESPERTCVQTVTGKGVTALRVHAGDRDPVVLRPLRGSEAAPVNGFMACWEPGVAFDDVRAEPVDG